MCHQLVALRSQDVMERWESSGVDGKSPSFSVSLRCQLALKR